MGHGAYREARVPAGRGVQVHHLHLLVNHGLTIADEDQAMYMTDCAMEMGYRYADTPEEAAE